MLALAVIVQLLPGPGLNIGKFYLGLVFITSSYLLFGYMWDLFSRGTIFEFAFILVLLTVFLGVRLVLESLRSYKK